jgi:hypothetical protein
MRPGRLAVLVGTLAATGALYLNHLDVDGAAFRVLTGGSVPSIWQELGKWGRPVAALLAAGLVAVAFRPGAGALDWWGSAVGVLLAGGAVAGGWLVRQAAAADAAVVSAALGEAAAGGPGASAGAGFWLLLAGTAVAAAGVLWDVVVAWRGRASAPSVGEQDPPAV